MASGGVFSDVSGDEDEVGSRVEVYEVEGDDDDDGYDKKLKKQLFEAAKGGDVTFVTDTLNQHPDYINIRDKSWFNETLLFRALRWKHIDVAKLLLLKGANINEVNDGGQTPLHKAALYGSVKAVKLLCEQGADINTTDNNGWTPLYAVAFFGRVEAVKLLCEQGADVNMTNNEGKTPLLAAVERNNGDVVRYLINEFEEDITKFDQVTQLKIQSLLKASSHRESSESLEKMLGKLEQAKASGETLKVSYTTILFSGSSGVGKTSLFNKLNKKQLNKNHHSTGVAKSEHTICVKTTAFVKSSEGLQWINLDYNTMISYLNKHLQNLKLIPLKSLTGASPSLEKFSQSNSDAKIAASAQIPSTAKSQHFVKINKEIERDIAKADSSDMPSLGEVWDIINFLDTGGQPEFVNILPAVSSSISLTFIVFNLSKSLDGLVHVQHNVNGDPSFKPYNLDCTNLEFIKRLMVSAENFNKNITPSLPSIQREDGENDSKVCYVGTHALTGNISKKEVQEIDDRLISIASELGVHQKSFWSSPMQHLKALYPIDLFPEEKESFEDIIEGIRDNIQKQVQKREFYEIPIVWFIFLLQIQKLCQDKKLSYILYEEAVDVWKGMNTDKNELELLSAQDMHKGQTKSAASREKSDVHNVLLFFHFMGMLFYYHKVSGICDFVFVDRQWLFNKLTELVEVKFTKKNVNVDDVEKFASEGRLNISIIKNLKIDLQGIQVLHFINLLDHLNIIAPINSELKEYFMPCVLPGFPVEKNVDLDKFYGSVKGVPLLVGLKNGPLPHGFFCHLIVELFRNLPQDWNPPLLPILRTQHVYNNLITFSIISSGHAVSLFYKLGYLDIQVRHKKSHCTVIHYDVKHEVDKALRRVSDHLTLDKEQLCYGFYCTCQNIQHFSKLKECTSSPEYICCGYGYTELTEDHRMWLKDVMVYRIDPSQLFIKKEPKMSELLKFVVPKVAACWDSLAFCLDFEISTVENIKETFSNNPEKCCKKVFIHWLTSKDGVGPKTWETLLNTLKEITNLAAATEEIEKELNKKYSTN